MQNTGQVQKWVQRNGSVTIPKGGSFRLMVDLAPKKRGVSIVEMTTLLIFDKGGNLFRQCNKTRPRAQVRIRRRSMQLPVRRCVLQETSTHNEKRTDSGCGPAKLAASRRQSSPQGAVAAATSTQKASVIPSSGQAGPCNPTSAAAGADAALPIVWRKFLKSVGISGMTGWRWRKLGWIKTVEIAGKPYVPQAEVERFNARLAAGEFAGMRAVGRVKKGGQSK